uniref:NAD_binding_2 domain-containing protein n=1 Tax=Anisakis simplex TaxID=6269 RepID=A0A0M3JJV2_ANISI
LGEKGFLFVGSGISGGEEGARHGPSMMPGGAPEAWPHIKDIFQKVSAKVGTESCCDWVCCLTLFVGLLCVNDFVSKEGLCLDAETPHMHPITIVCDSQRAV